MSDKDNDPGYRYKGEVPVHPPEVQQYNRRKNTKRWCKGKVGREHVRSIEYNRRWNWNGVQKPCNPESPVWWAGCRHHEVCTVCGKELRWDVRDECPDLTRP